jgi:hypothetical protein
MLLNKLKGVLVALVLIVAVLAGGSGYLLPTHATVKTGATALPGILVNLFDGKEINMKVDLWKLSDIKPYPGNPRHNDQAVDAVAASIQAFGFLQPIVVDEHGVIVVGHTRYKAALKLGLETVPVYVATYLTPAQVKAYRIADNKTAELATWNQDLLLQEILNLQQQNCDLAITGFSTEELSQLLDTGTPTGLGDPDDIPQPPDQATTQPGDLWLLGEHRLLLWGRPKVRRRRPTAGWRQDPPGQHRSSL